MPSGPDSSEFVYDGRKRAVEIESDLGDAVNVSYSGNTAVNAGRILCQGFVYRRR